MGIPNGLQPKVASTIILLALVIHIIVAISLPFIRQMYIIETSLSDKDMLIGGVQNLTMIRVSLAKL